MTLRALRYYESAGLVVPTRLPNGYRDYDPLAVRLVDEIRSLTELGLSVAETRPFVECLASGHGAGDECPASMAAYRDAIVHLSAMIDRLTERRDALAAHLEAAANRAIPSAAPTDLMRLPPGLPAPSDDGAAAHLAGLRLPGVPLPTTEGSTVRLDELGAGRSVVYVYPLTGRPGLDVPEGWDAIPGARGCTVQACDFRDHYQELRDARASRVFGLSSQTSDYQKELVERLNLPFAMISDPGFTLPLPTFEAGGMTFYRRLTLIITDGVVEHVFYPVFPPDRHADEVLDWLRARVSP